MSMNRCDTLKKLSSVTSRLLREKGYLCFVDVFAELGYLSRRDYEDWRMKRIPYLERVIRVNRSRISFIMKAVRSNSIKGGLEPSFTAYESWGKGRKIRLRFSKSRNPYIENLYATHFVSRRLRREKLRRKGRCPEEGKPSGGADAASEGAACRMRETGPSRGRADR